MALDLKELSSRYNQLQQVVQEALQSVPHALLVEHGFAQIMMDIETLEFNDLASLPDITKREAQNRYSHLIDLLRDRLTGNISIVEALPEDAPLLQAVDQELLDKPSVAELNDGEYQTLYWILVYARVFLFHHSVEESEAELSEDETVSEANDDDLVETLTPPKEALLPLLQQYRDWLLNEQLQSLMRARLPVDELDKLNALLDETFVTELGNDQSQDYEFIRTNITDYLKLGMFIFDDLISDHYIPEMDQELKDYVFQFVIVLELIKGMTADRSRLRTKPRPNQ